MKHKLLKIPGKERKPETIAIGPLYPFDTPYPGSFIMNYKHGLSKHRLFRIWVFILDRCSNPNATGYKNYGARGIKVCDEWENDFKVFYDYVTQLSHYGESGMTLDRTDNDGNYEPGNLRWVNMHIQRVNSRSIKSKTGYTGVYANRNNFLARVKINYKNINLGTYSTIKEAVEDRNQYIIDNNLTEYPIQVYKPPKR